MMSAYEYFLFFLALVFCGYASYADLKTQKIPNLCSIGLLYLGTLSQLMVWYLGTTTPLYILGLFFGSGLIAFAFYWFGIFSPGDSKLFWGLCLILPLSLFGNQNGILSFPPLILVLNIIIPYSVGLSGYLVFKFVLMQNKWALFRGFLMSKFQRVVLLEKFFNLLFFIGVGSALTYPLELMGWKPDQFVHLILVLATFALVRRLLSPLTKTPVYYTIIVFICVWLAVRSASSVSVFLSSFVFFLGLYLVVFVLVKQLVMSLANMMLDNAVDVSSLQVGMIPAEQIVQIAQSDGTVRYEKRQVEFSRDRDDIIVTPDPMGLDAEKIAHLHSLAAEGAFAEFGNQIKVQPSIRFAPVISLGALLTILCKGPFYLKLMEFL